MKNKNKAQALTEFIILIPIFFIFFIGILQFYRIFMTKIKIAILERELMMYLVSDIDEEEKADEFVKNYSEILGLKYENLTVEYKGGIGGMLKGNIVTNLFNKFISMRVVISYKEKLISPFSLITGKEYIQITTDLHTAHGGSFNITLDNIIEKAKNLFGVNTEN